MAKTSKDFLGRGWSFPPTFANDGRDLEMVAGIEDIRQSLEILLGASNRERLLHDDFGCNLRDFLFEEIDQHLVNRLRRVLSEAILYHEPRIKVQKIDIDAGRASEGRLLITISFTVRGANSRYNLVYPFYLREAVNPG